MLHEFWNRLRWLLRGRSHGEVDEELAFHLERHTELNVAAGMTPEEARQQALVAFGGVERTREACREERPMYRLEMLGHDLRYAVRGIRRNPVFSIAVVLTLMLGVGSLSLQRQSRSGPKPLNMFVPAGLLPPILDDLARGQPAHPPRPWLGVLAQEVGDHLVVVGASPRGPAVRRQKIAPLVAPGRRFRTAAARPRGVHRTAAAAAAAA